MRPYRTIPIIECGEPLLPVPRSRFGFFEPHPYMSAGAPYGGASPWLLRAGVLKALEQAQDHLATAKPGWRIKIFDAYRPNAVQAYMVEQEFRLQAKTIGTDLTPYPDSHALQAADPALYDRLAAKVFRLWGMPSDDPATPPPHSTGAAIDCTLADATGIEVNMGSPIDENSDRSNPDYFATATGAADREAHANRLLLRQLMNDQGFQMLAVEWWHFSLGDQHWAWCQRENGISNATARYGRAA